MAAKATNTALKDLNTEGSARAGRSGGRKKKTASAAGNHKDFARNSFVRENSANKRSRRMETMGSRGSSGKTKKKKETRNNTLSGQDQTARRGAGIPMGNEITLVVSAGFTILMMLSNFGLCGWVGRVLSYLFFGIFGFSQYIMPAVLFVIVLLLLANDYSGLAIRKSAAMFGLMLILSGFSQLIAAPEGYVMDEIFGDSAANHFLGGVIAGGITEFLRSGLGIAGAVIILSCLLILSLVVLTQKSAITFFRQLFSRLLVFRANQKERARIRKDRRQEEKERMEYEEELPVFEEEDWSFPDEVVDTPDDLRAQKVEDKVRALEDEIQESRRKGRKKRTDKKGPDVHVPVLVSSDKVHAGDSLRELHPEAVPFADDEGKTDPFEGDLDYSAFRLDQDSYPELTEEVMKALKREKISADREKTAGPASSLGSSLEEIRIHHGNDDEPVGEEDGGSEEYAGTSESSDLAGKGMIEIETKEEEDFPWDDGKTDEWIEGRAEEKTQTSGRDDSFHFVEEAPEDEDMDPREAMKMSRTPVSSKEKKAGRAGASAASARKSAPANRASASSVSSASEAGGKESGKKQTEPVINRAKEPAPLGDQAKVRKADYVFPPMNLLTRDDSRKEGELDEDLKETAMKLQQTLHSFGVNVKITDISCGPSVTRYELFPEQGVKVSKIVSLTDDIKLNLAAADVRIEAPIPGKAAIGIEVPNKKIQMVHFRDLIDNRTFRNMKSRLAFAAGKDIGGKIVMADLAKMPHMLVAGTTGSGKSVFINTIIMSILYKSTPEEVRFIMVDPKMVELSVYNGIPHLLIPVVTDPKKASGALSWAVAEMTDRYRKFAETGTRNLSGYNKKVETLIKSGEVEEGKLSKLPQIVIIIDELADLMMVAKSEVEDAIVRLSQLARAAGIHMVIATQRPSVDVITGLIKANVPSRVALSVSSGTDSRTILDMNGAEKLLGNGDMLFYPSGYQKPVRVQGAYISDEDIIKVTDFLRDNAAAAAYDQSISEKIEKKMVSGTASQDRDEYFEAAARFIMEKDKATIGMLQRMFKIGFNRAARIIDQLYEAGIVGPEEGTRPRKITMSPEELDLFFEENA